MDEQIYIPDQVVPAEAFARTSHLGIAAHPDDLEFAMFHGIASCYEHEDAWFGGIVACDGRGSPRSGSFANCPDSEMIDIRRAEQISAARIGKYSFVSQCGYDSSELRRSDDDSSFVQYLERVLLMSQPEVLYTHSPLDRHRTHLAVTQQVITAIKRLPPYSRPKKVYGCELWGSLDWLETAYRVSFDSSDRFDLQNELMNCFESQIAGGKNYGEAIIGRQRANAVLSDPYSVDDCEGVTFAIDLTSLCEDEGPDLSTFVRDSIDRFATSTIDRIAQLSD